MSVHKVNEKHRVIKFINGDYLQLFDVTEVDNSGSYLRLTTKTGYHLINPSHVMWHTIPLEDKEF